MDMEIEMFIIPQWLQLPRICLICEMFFKKNTPICARCEKKIKPLDGLCFFCSEPCLEKNCRICLSCQYQASNIRKIFVFFEYIDPVRALISDFKFQHGYDLVDYLTDIFIKHLPDDAKNTECLIPVPLHKKKHAQRGYHHTYLLAKTLGKKLSIPVKLDYCKKIKHTAAQSQLKHQERQQNLNDAFFFKKPPFQKITLIDDIITTGATIKTIAQGLQGIGVENIDAWCLAKVFK